MPLPPKKRGMDVEIAVSPHGKGLGTPLPVERMDQQESDAAPEDETPEHEATEAPGQEQGEDAGGDYAAKLMADIESVGKRYGADGETSRALFADFLESAARCLKVGSGEDQGAEASADTGDEYTG